MSEIHRIFKDSAFTCVRAEGGVLYFRDNDGVDYKVEPPHAKRIGGEDLDTWVRRLRVHAQPTA